MAATTHTPPHSADAHDAHHHGAGRYWLIWAALLVGTVITYFTATHLDLGRFQLALAMIIATTKASLVVLFFMHLAEHKGTNRIIFVMSVFFALLLLALVLGDVATRFPMANPPTGQTSHAPGYHPQTDEDVQGGKPQPGSPSKEHDY